MAVGEPVAEKNIQGRKWKDRCVGCAIGNPREWKESKDGLLRVFCNHVPEFFMSLAQYRGKVRAKKKK